MIGRILSGYGACAIAAVLAWQLQGQLPQEILRAYALEGSRWYKLELQDRHLGYWRTDTTRDVDGKWTFTSEQRFALNPGDPVTMTTRRVFSARPQHALQYAESWQDRRQWSQGTQIERTGTGYRARLLRQRVGESADTTQLDWTYGLADYLNFEVWLAQDERHAGDARVVPTLDFDRLQVVPKKFQVVARNEAGYLIKNPAPFAATTIQLDAEFATVELKVAGLFDLRRATKQAALAPRSTLQSASYFIPTDTPLRDHTQIARIRLGISSDSPIDALWSAMEEVDGQWTMTLNANPVSTHPDAASAPAATLAYPSNHAKITQLANLAVADSANDAAKVRALTAFVNQYLSYKPGTAPRGVLALLDNPVGDCTEFADLFTTLARSLGLPSRTVFGLAYSEQEQPAFAFHAWNEVAVHNVWQAVDPTWNQTRVDATHLPLPQDEAAALQLLTGSLQLQFSVQDVVYFDDL